MSEENQHCSKYLVDEGTFLANIEPGIFLGLASFNVKEGCVFVLVPQTTFVASEDGLGIEPTKNNVAYHLEHSNTGLEQE